MYSKIKNPQTNKQVSINSKLGKKILLKYIKFGGKPTVEVSFKEMGAFEAENPWGTTTKQDNKIKTPYCHTVKPIYNSNINLKDIINNLRIVDEKLETEWNGALFKSKPENKSIFGEEIKFGKSQNAFVEEHILENNEGYEISILEKKPKNPEEKLKEAIMLEDEKYKQLFNGECPYIIPIKSINNSVFMLKGNGDLYDLVVSTNQKGGAEPLEIHLADKIINSLTETLLCLKKYNLYYFDIRKENIVYMCIDGIMYLWFVNLGGMIFSNQPEFAKCDCYLIRNPHPVFNQRFVYNPEIPDYNPEIPARNQLSNECISKSLMDFYLYIYVYDLTHLFFDLILWDFTQLKKEHYEINKYTNDYIYNSLNDKFTKLKRKYFRTNAQNQRIIYRYLIVYQEILDHLREIVKLDSNYYDIYKYTNSITLSTPKFLLPETTIETSWGTTINTSWGNEISLNPKEICNIELPSICNSVHPMYDSDIFSLINNLKKVNGVLETNWKNVRYIFNRSNKIGEGGLGIVNNLIFRSEKDEKDEIALLEKLSIDPTHKLEEISILENPKNHKILNELCSYIIPYKIINDRFYMLKGHGSLWDLANKVRLSVSLADKIIKCLANTLKCLYDNGVYYFDIKIENVVYMCVDNEMFIWLIDLGSIIPRNKNGILSYVCTCPHPVFNLKIYDFDNFVRSNDRSIRRLSNNITPKLLPFTLNIYSYQLSLFLLQLIGIPVWLSHNNINDESLNSINASFKRKLTRIENHLKLITIPTENDILQKHYNTYKEIMDQLDHLKFLNSPERLDEITGNLSEKVKINNLRKKNYLESLSENIPVPELFV